MACKQGQKHKRKAKEAAKVDKDRTCMDSKKQGEPGASDKCLPKTKVNWCAICAYRSVHSECFDLTDRTCSLEQNWEDWDQCR